MSLPFNTRPAYSQTNVSPTHGPALWHQPEEPTALPTCGCVQLPMGSLVFLSSHHSGLAFEHTRLVYLHLGTLLHPPWVPEASPHTLQAHVCVHWAVRPGDPPSLGWLSNGHNLILIEPLHCKPVQGLVSAEGKDRCSEGLTPKSKNLFASPQPPPHSPRSAEFSSQPVL